MATEQILIVEDDSAVAKMLQARLTQMSYTVVLATNGVDALEMAWEKIPDLILLDVMMPKVNGFEVAKILRETPKTREIPIIFLTALTQVSDKVRGLGLGADDYITKPFHFEELAARISAILKRARTPSGRGESPTAFGMSGTLHEMSLPALLQVLGAEKKTGTLVLTRGGARGLLAVEEGEITHALTGSLLGEKALYHLLTWEAGEFVLEPLNRDLPPTSRVEGSTSALLLEGMRRRDERNRLLAQLPPLMTRLKIGSRLRALLTGKTLTQDLASFLRLFDGSTPLSTVLERSGLDELVALEHTVKLYTKGMLERA